MQPRTLALIFAAAIAGSGCASKESKPESAPPPVAVAATPVTVAETAPVASKPECPPEPKTKAKSTKSKKSKKNTKTEPVAVDCEPAKPKNMAEESKASQPVAAAPTAATPAPAKAAVKPTEAGQPRMMKSVDGTFEGEVYGKIPPNSKWAKLQIGMEQPQVERILGGTSAEVRTHPTAKAFIPFYFGTDRFRYEVVYRGQGSVSYTGGSWGSGSGVLMMINYDPNI